MHYPEYALTNALTNAMLPCTQSPKGLSNKSKAPCKMCKDFCVKIHLINARSVCNKIHYLKAYVDDCNPDILAITETWGNKTLIDGLITPKGFTLFRRDRLFRKGGGVALLVRDELTPVDFVIPDNFNHEFDSVWCTLRSTSGKIILIGCVYRPPTSSESVDISISDLFDFASVASHDYRVILGDFNVPHIDWKLLKADKHDQTFLEGVLKNCLTQVVTSPTRGDSLLDLVFVNDVSLISSVQVDESFPGSDHLTVKITLAIDVMKKATSGIVSSGFFFSRANWIQYRKLISEHDRDEIRLAGDADVAWVALKNIIYDAANASIPRVKHKTIRNVPLSGNVRRAFRHRKNVYRTLRGSTTSLANDLRDQANKYLDDALISNRKRIESSIAYQCGRNPKKFWAHVRSSLANKPKVTTVLNSKGIMSQNDKETACIFNEFFSSAFNDAEIDVQHMTAWPSSDSKLSTFSVSVDSIKKVLKNLPSHSSPGPDGISNILLKEGGLGLLLLIFDFFSLLISIGALPSEWKTAEVVPIFKKGNRHECNNYRPISLTCTLCKVFERLLKDAMLGFLVSNNLLNDTQHGFLPNRSCCTALLTFLETITRSIDNNTAIDVIYLDFRKAFDSVPHNRLIHKLRKIGFDGDIINLIESFLADRYQRVKVANSCSDSIRVTSGVPQGSVLGPLLFVVYINDIDSYVSSHLIKFADDVRLFLPVDPSQIAPLQCDLNRISEWCSAWLLELNVSKCACLHIGYNNPSHSYHIDGTNIAEVDSIIDLGISITKNLKPTSQCHLAAAKAHKMISIIKLAFRFLDANSLTLLYKSFVRPVLEYCGVAWCPYFIKDIEVLERVQRRFTRLLPEVSSLPYEERLSKLGLKTLHTRRLIYDLTFMYKIIHGMIDVNHNHFFSMCSDSRTRGHNLKLAMSYSRLDVRKFFFSSRVVQAWNELPNNCADAPSLESFKIELFKHLHSCGAR